MIRVSLITAVIAAIFGLVPWNGLAAQTKPPAGNPTPTAATVPEGSPSDLSPEMEAKLNEAVDQFNRQDVAGALVLLKELAATDARMIPPRLILAQWFSQMKNTNAVRVSLEMATEESPNDPESFLLLGEIALRQGEWTAAELLFQKAESLLAAYQANPERHKKLTTALLKNKIAVAQHRKRWSAMQELLGALLKIEGETAENCTMIGVSFFQLDKTDPARQWFARAEQLAEGKGLPADAMMAQLYLAKGESDAAKKSLAAALAARPDSAAVMTLSLSLALGDNDMATVGRLADQLFAAHPDDPAALKTCGIAALFQENFPKAEQYFTKAMTLAPTDTEIINGLALALCEQNTPEKLKLAQQHAASNIQKQGNNREFLATFGWVLYKAGNIEQAMPVLQQSAADGQVNAATAYYLAVLLSEKGEKENAKKIVTAALGNKTPFFKRKAATELLSRL